MVLPATSDHLRSLVNQRRYSYSYDADKPVSYDAVVCLTRLIESEISFQKKRAEAQAQLQQSQDFNLMRTFSTVAPYNSHLIHLHDLIYFLENNGYYPTREDLEAILRRCDHDADRCFTLDEFQEVVQGLQ
jgi:hypothetical protein